MAKTNIPSLFKICLDEGNIALNEGNYPIGSIIINQQDKIIAQDHNRNTTTCDITAHAEILCLRKATQKQLSKDLSIHHTLITTEEPCNGCAFFIARTNINKVIWLLSDPHRPGISQTKSLYPNIFANIQLIAEPSLKLKKVTQKMMYDYFIKAQNQQLANLFITP